MVVRVRSPLGAPSLRAAVGSGRQHVRAAAAQWLAALGCSEAVPQLRSALASEKVGVVQESLLSALEQLGVDIDELMDRDRLVEEALEGLAKARRILVPFLAWCLGLGDGGRAIVLYILICWLATLGGVALAGYEIVRRGGSPLWTAVLLFQAGVVVTVERPMPDGAAAALVVLALVLWDRGRDLRPPSAWWPRRWPKRPRSSSPRPWQPTPGAADVAFRRC